MKRLSEYGRLSLEFRIKELVRSQIRFLFSPRDFLRDQEEKLLLSKWVELTLVLFRFSPSVFCSRRTKQDFEEFCSNCAKEEIEAAWVELRVDCSENAYLKKSLLLMFEKSFSFFEHPSGLKFWRVLFSILIHKLPFRELDLLALFKKRLYYLKSILGSVLN